MFVRLRRCGAGPAGGVVHRYRRLIVRLAVAVVMLARPISAAAQNRPELMTLPPEVSGYIRMGGLLYDDHFQLSNDGPRLDLWAGVLEVRIEEHLGREGGFRAYTRGDLYQFQHRGLSPGLLGGFRRADGANRFDLSLAAQWNRPRFDGGDELEHANILAANGSYSLVISSLELKAEAEYRNESLKLNPDEDSVSHDAGAAVRYGVFRQRLWLEVGALRGGRETSNPSRNYEQDTTYVSVRVSAIPRVNLSARYRSRVRGYTIEDPDARNFGRQDRRTQISGYVDIALGGNLVWNLSGGLEEGRSSRRTRVTRSRQFATGLSVRLSGS